MTFWQFSSKTRTEEKEVMPINIYGLDHNGKIDAAIEKFKKKVKGSKKKKYNNGCSTYSFYTAHGKQLAVILSENYISIIDDLTSYDLCKKGDSTNPKLISDFKEWLESFQYENTKSDLDKYLEAP